LDPGEEELEREDATDAGNHSHGSGTDLIKLI
jgi:hypothetical protein